MPDLSIAPALMVGLAAFAPLASEIGALLEMLVFGALRPRGQRAATIPGALWLYVGSSLGTGVLSMFNVRGSALVVLS